jgi:hypothetical protein
MHVALPWRSTEQIQQVARCENEVLSEKQKNVNSFDFQ